MIANESPWRKREGVSPAGSWWRHLICVHVRSSPMNEMDRSVL